MKLTIMTVMLTHEAENAPFQTYPTLKLVDFGIADLTGDDDKNNPDVFIRGTDPYKPPVRKSLLKGAC
jgi:hypothetical protein